ncbi:Carboxylate-amine ligase YbdK [Rubripirellula obstinata]|uniref:Putative glutamate--cysteine ligase 2 n=1 Tax=Rubripirellula obstinata TaxID=406547 RepID=A0A5B1CK99_9BACT|nr:glutamate--cysteine ligase [Rubripirellula obstinata]KAA1261478.1 Carboxylate-amine ligase YbdK [Rubripirellula obstinata]
MNQSIPTVGVEEEYQLVDPMTGELLPNCKDVMKTLRRSGDNDALDSDIQHELHLNQIEMASDVCNSLAEVRETLSATRSRLIEAAKANDCELASAGTNPLPLPNDSTMTPKDRYQSMTDRYQHIARELYIFGCHVHVAMEDRELGLQVMNRCRRWLPLLQAITANSPYWDGADTGYASFRRELWAQWPMAGPPPHFESLKDYESCVDELTNAGAIKDESFIYWDIRLPTKVPTIEFRGADVMTRVDETVGYVGLVRAMVMTAVKEIQRDQPPTIVRPSVLSYSLWHSARFGVTDQLIDVATCERVAASEWVSRVMDELDESLHETGERQPVDSFVQSVLDDGTGADRQRKAGDLADVVKIVVDETCPNQSVAELANSFGPR